MKGKFVRAKIADLKRQPIRQDHGTQEELKALARSYLECAIHPIICRRDMTVGDGNRRVEGLGLLGQTEIEVFVADEDLSDADLLEIALASDIHRASVCFYDKCQAIRKWEELHPGISGKEIAEKLKVDPAQITRLKSLFKCIPEVQEAARIGKLDSSSVYAISKVETEAGQRELLAAKLGGATRDEIEKRGRKARNRAAPTVKLARVRCPLSTGTTVVVSGASMDLSGMIDALSAALDCARKASKESLDVKTAQRVWADKAKVIG
jgi:ParB family transcriptional regulator, chromosome partitioning protein